MKVAILGYGKEGQASLRYFREKNADITVFDERQRLDAKLPKDIKFVGGKEAFVKLEGYEVIVRSPPIHPGRLKVADAVRVTSVTDIFFQECPAQIIGVTGTKGKGTTSSLIFEILKAAGEGVHLAGNIGTPALDILPDVRVGDIVILELSSFQLWDLKQSPHVAVVLMVEADHLDVHNGMEEYVTAKMNIARWQTQDDIVIVHPTNKISQQIAAPSKGRHYKYGEPPAAHVKNGHFVIDEQIICSIHDLLIPGEHNRENACAAITAVWQYTHNIDAIAEALRNFKGLEHRIEKVRELQGVTYYNDSFSSAPGATIAAIKSFTQPEVVIVGGYDKQVDFTELAETVAKKENVKKVLLIGQTKDRLAESFKKAGFTQYETMQMEDFKEIIEKAQKAADSGDVVLLSPACASFGMFENFYERGRQFKKIVEELR